MNVFHPSDLQQLSDFPNRQDQLAIVNRETPSGANGFFETLMRTPLRVIGHVYKRCAEDDITYLLGESIPEKLQTDPFYALWVSDMAQVSKSFCDVLGTKAVGFCLSTTRGCRRYHIDNVPMRMLVTYAGKGTEWLPDEAADRDAYIRGASNEEIVKDPSARQFIEPWNIAIFRGESDGLLHRTPDSALEHPSILMRLDHEKFWDNILEHQEQSKAA